MKKIYEKKRLRRLAAVICAALTAGTLGFAPVLYAHPILDSKDAAVSITGTTDMSITSGAENNLIKWVDFSIGKNEKVAFDGNNYLNYVTGSARSDILGTLTGGGSIYLVNPNGILIGDGAIVDVGSLHLSTKNLDVSQLTDYDKGLNLLTSATAAGDVINMGRLNATSISVEGNNITFKNVADVTSGATLGNDGTLTGGTRNNAVTLTANSGGEIHIGSVGGTTSGYAVSGAEEIDYKLVRTEEELQAIKNDLTGNYMLANNITLPDVGEGQSNFTPIGAPWGYLNGGEFTGKFDGLNHTITNLIVHNGNVSERESGKTYSAGLFGGSSGTIENLGLVGGVVSGSSESYAFHFVGGIVGRNTGTVRNVYHTGEVKGGTGSGTYDVCVGGVVGSNSGGTILNAYNTGNVTSSWAYNQFIGGIAGKNQYYDTEHDATPTIQNVYNAGSVSSTSTGVRDCYIGGIVGLMKERGIVKDAYNVGTVTGNKQWDIGGIVGYSISGSTSINDFK